MKSSRARRIRHSCSAGDSPANETAAGEAPAPQNQKPKSSRQHFRKYGLRHKNIKLELDDLAKDFLVEKGYDPQYGARPMRRAVERFLEDPLAEEILKGSLQPGEPILVTSDKAKLVFNQKAAAAGAVAG